MMDSLTALFCLIDDFCQVFEPAWHKQLLADGRPTADESDAGRPASPCRS